MQAMRTVLSYHLSVLMVSVLRKDEHLFLSFKIEEVFLSTICLFDS